MSTDIFLQATRSRLRFKSPVGDLSVEDLWEIPLTSVSPNKASIEGIGAVLLDRQAKLQGGSILRGSKPSKERAEVDLAVEVLRAVATIRQDEAEAKTLEAMKQSKREQLQALIAERELKEASVDDLKAQLAALN